MSKVQPANSTQVPAASASTTQAGHSCRPHKVDQHGFRREPAPDEGNGGGAGGGKLGIVQGSARASCRLWERGSQCAHMTCGRRNRLAWCSRFTHVRCSSTWPTCSSSPAPRAGRLAEAARCDRDLGRTCAEGKCWRQRSDSRQAGTSFVLWLLLCSCAARAEALPTHRDPTLCRAVASYTSQESPFNPLAEPRTVMLNNKMKMPLVGAHVKDAETARWVDDHR